MPESFSRSFLIAVAVLSLAALTEAQPHELVVNTFPPGAKMTDQFDSFLGESGQSILIKWDRSKGPLEVNFTLDGHQLVTRTLSYREIERGVYPTSGAVDLPAESRAVALLDFVRYRWTLGLPLLGLLVGIGIWARRRSTAIIQKYPKFGRYQALEVLGRGGSSEVYRAEAVGSDEKSAVALKVLRELGENALKRFQREVQACLKYQHPNIMQLYDWGEHSDGRPYLVTELLEGETLSERLEREQKLEPAIANKIVASVGGALDYLHKQGVAHRDVKPSNVFLCRDGRVKLFDLGIAKTDDFEAITQTGVAVGTPHYMAPEQIQGDGGPASDQYALGIMTFEMLSGNRPFGGRDAVELYKKHMEADPPELQVEGCSQILDHVVRRMLAKAPKNRFPSVWEAVAKLQEALSGDSELEDETRVG